MRPAVASIDGFPDKKLKTVYLGNQRPDPNRLHPFPGNPGAYIVWDGGYNGYAFHSSGDVSEASRQALAQIYTSGAIKKVRILPGTVVTNKYVVWRTNRPDYAEIWEARNCNEGYRIPEGEDREVTDCAGAWFSAGTCANLLIWTPPPAPRPNIPTVDVPVEKIPVFRWDGDADSELATPAGYRWPVFKVHVAAELRQNVWKEIGTLEFDHGHETKYARGLDPNFRYRFREEVVPDWTVEKPIDGLEKGVYYFDPRVDALRKLVFVNAKCLKRPCVDVEVEKIPLVYYGDGPDCEPPAGFDLPTFQVWVYRDEGTEDNPNWKKVRTVDLPGHAGVWVRGLERGWRYRFTEALVNGWDPAKPKDGTHYLDLTDLSDTEQPRKLVFINHHQLRRQSRITFEDHDFEVREGLHLPILSQDRAKGGVRTTSRTILSVGAVKVLGEARCRECGHRKSQCTCKKGGDTDHNNQPGGVKTPGDGRGHSGGGIGDKKGGGKTGNTD